MSILISSLPLLILSLFFYNQLKSITESQLQQAVHREAEIASQNLSDFLSERQGNMREWAQSSAVLVAYEFGRPEGLKQYLEFLKQQYPVYDWISAVKKGRLFSFHEENTAQFLSLMSFWDKDNPSDHSFFIKDGDLYFYEKITVRQAKHSGKQVGSDFLIAKINRNKFLNFAEQLITHLERFNFSSINVVYKNIPDQSTPITDVLNQKHANLQHDERDEICPNSVKNFSASICVSLLKGDLRYHLIRLQVVMVLVTLALAFLTFVLLNKVLQKFMDPFFEILKSISAVTEGVFSKVQFHSKLKETQLIETQFNSIVEKLQDASTKLKEHARHSAFYEISMQVAHDIRSPLSALEMLTKSLDEVPDSKRLLIKNSVQRINDISNDLLAKGKSNKGLISTNTSMTIVHRESFLEVEIERLVSEKRIQYREKNNIEISAEIKARYGVFAHIQAKELQRVLSNLVNNSVENLEMKANNKGRPGKVKITLSSDTEAMATVTVSDNGSGIPPEILPLLGARGTSFGKENSVSGSGLGIFHAKHAMSSCGGDLLIESMPDLGTSIILKIPLAPPPKWFLEELQIKTEQTIIILDDDTAIHGLWKQRLNSTFMEVNIRCFVSGAQFKQWYYKTRNPSEKFLFLIDYELLNQPQNGIEIIEELNLADQSILVTSRFEESQIIEKCQRLNLKQIPKLLAASIPIRGLSSNLPKNQSPDLKLSTEIRQIKYDLCLIDDDKELIHAVWGSVANEKGLSIKMFTNPQEFYAEADKIDRLTPVYVDVSLGEGVRGTEIAYEIHKLGFTEIHLTTGYDANSIDVPSFIRKVVGKDFPALKS